MKTFRITVAYDGTAYAGWQVQPDAATVQGVLERAAERLNGERTPVLGAGRTDAGVHAEGQAARFTTPRDLAAERVPHALNAFLPEDVVVTAAVEVAPEFHPIRDAVAKHYRYSLKSAEFDDPFDRRYVLRIPAPPDLAAMREAAGHLAGTHDFAGFEKAGSPREHSVRTLTRLDVVEEGAYIRLHFVANGFLYGMARNLAGTLLRAGQGALAPDALPDGLSARSRSVAGPCLPAHALCLMRVHYETPQPEERMNVNIVGRHVQLNSQIEDFATEKFSKLDRYFSDIQHVDVVLGLEGHGAAKLCSVEATVTLGQGARLIGKGEAEEMLAAIDMAETRLQKQIRRFNARLKTRRDRTRASHDAKAAPVGAEEETYEEIVREMLEEGEE